MRKKKPTVQQEFVAMRLFDFYGPKFGVEYGDSKTNKVTLHRKSQEDERICVFPDGHTERIILEKQGEEE